MYNYVIDKIKTELETKIAEIKTVLIEKTITNDYVYKSREVCDWDNVILSCIVEGVVEQNTENLIVKISANEEDRIAVIEALFSKIELTELKLIPHHIVGIPMREETEKTMYEIYAKFYAKTESKYTERINRISFALCFTSIVDVVSWEV